MDQALQTPEHAVRFRNPHACDLVRALPCVGDRIYTKFVGVARRTEVGDVVVLKYDADSVSVKNAGDRLFEAEFCGEDGLELFADQAELLGDGLLDLEHSLVRSDNGESPGGIGDFLHVG